MALLIGATLCSNLSNLHGELGQQRANLLDSDTLQRHLVGNVAQPREDDQVRADALPGECRVEKSRLAEGVLTEALLTEALLAIKTGQRVCELTCLSKQPRLPEWVISKFLADALIAAEPAGQSSEHALWVQLRPSPCEPAEESR